jgi:hypothetical protein
MKKNVESRFLWEERERLKKEASFPYLPRDSHGSSMGSLLGGSSMGSLLGGSSMGSLLGQRDL